MNCKQLSLAVTSGSEEPAEAAVEERVEALAACRRAQHQSAAARQEKEQLRRSAEAHLSLFNSYATSQTVTHNLSLSGDKTISIQIAQSVLCGVGGLLWPCGEVLANHLAAASSWEDGCLRLPSLERPESVVWELGCGAAALPAMTVAALYPCSVVATDTEDILHITRENISRNLEQFQPKGSLTLSPFCWGETTACPVVDVIIAADVIYADRLNIPLIFSIQSLLKSDGVLLLSYAQRIPSLEQNFLKMLGDEGFAVAVIDNTRHNGHTVITVRAQRSIIIPSKSLPMVECTSDQGEESCIPGEGFYL